MRRLASALVACALLLTGVSAQGAVRSPGVHVTTSDDAAAAASGSGSAYAFAARDKGKPVRWNPCVPIHWRYRTAGQVTGGLAQVKAAVKAVSKATRTTWVYDGTSTTAPTTAWLPTSLRARPPVLIGWTDATHSDLLRNQPANVVALTRTAWFALSDGGVIHGAVVALNIRAHLPLTGPDSWNAVVTHELGHVMGLAHAGSTHELMYKTMSKRFATYQAGDLAGLKLLGLGQGCI